MEQRRVWAAWDTYTATWSSTGTQPAIGNGTIVGKFRRDGITGYCRGAISMGTSTTFGTGEWRVSLPSGWTASNDPATDGFQIGEVLMSPAAGSAYAGFCWATPNLTVLRLVTNAAIPASVTATSPVAWSSNNLNYLSWNIVLELDPAS